MNRTELNNFVEKEMGADVFKTECQDKTYYSRLYKSPDKMEVCSETTLSGQVFLTVEIGRKHFIVNVADYTETTLKQELERWHVTL